MSTPAIFAVTFAALFAGHHIGDYWVQRNWQAQRKGLPGWPGRRACAAHVLTYTFTLAVFLGAVWWRFALPLTWPWVLAGLTVTSATHYWADRRSTLRKLAGRLGIGDFYAMGEGLATGAALLDQAWHIFMLFVSALIIAGGPR